MDTFPITFFADENPSAGAVVSGQILLTVKEQSLELQTLTAEIFLDLHYEQPLRSHCESCARTATLLEQWAILNRCTILKKGDHQFPFSTFLGAHHPTSTRNSLVTVSYRLKVVALSITSQDLIRLEMPLTTKRSLCRPDVLFRYVTSSIPTGLSCNVRYDRIIYPTGANAVQVTVAGLACFDSEGKVLSYWRLGDVNWTLEETICVVVPVCEKHNKPPQNWNQPASKGTTKRDIHVVNKGMLKGNWELMCRPAEVSAQLEFIYTLAQDQNSPVSFPHQKPKHGCAPDFHGWGIEVSHRLALKIEARNHNALTSPSTGLGQACSLRMSMPVRITEVPGGQLSWEDQIPPVYRSVSPGPPLYTAYQL